MQDNEQHSSPELAAVAPDDIAVPAEPSATVVVADGTHVPRYGAIPYGGLPTAGETKQDSKEH